MMYDLNTIKAHNNSGSVGLMKLAQELRAKDPTNKDLIYLDRAAMAMHEAAVQIDFFMKDTDTGHQIAKN